MYIVQCCTCTLYKGSVALLAYTCLPAIKSKFTKKNTLRNCLKIRILFDLPPGQILDFFFFYLVKVGG